MEADYDAILSDDFPDPEPSHSTNHISLEETLDRQHEQQQQQDQHAQIHNEIIDSSNIDGHLSMTHDGSAVDDSTNAERSEDQTHDVTLATGDPEPHVKTADAFVEEPKLPNGRKRGIAHLSAEEKRERMKDQNRKAAERSRNKKRGQVSQLEVQVNTFQEENTKLRQRLSELLAARNATAGTINEASSSITPPQASATNDIGIDYAYLSKLQSELSSAKSILLERELELARLKGAENSADVDVLRHLLLSHHTTLTNLQAETTSLESMISHLKTERDTLAKQTEVLQREVEARRALQNVSQEETETAIQNVNAKVIGAERALLDIRGYLDEAERSWNETSLLPAPGDQPDILNMAIDPLTSSLGQ